MTAEEILARCEEVGVLVAREERCIYDVSGSHIPYAETVMYVAIYNPGPGFSVHDGMCRTRRGEWLPWELYGKTWCFGDDDPYEVENAKLSETLYKRRTCR